MKHQLLRLTASIYNTPHLITPEALNPILEYLEARNTPGFERLDDKLFSPKYEEEDGPKYRDGLGVLYVDGSLTYKPVMTMCGEVGTSYQGLLSQVEEMAEAGVKTIAMIVDSPGGQAHQCFEHAQEVRDICDDNGIKLIGYADTVAASGGYAWLSICDEVIANANATVGSIGVVVALMDTSKAYEQAGIKKIYITAGANKVPFDEDGSFKKSFLQEIQADIDRLYEEFTSFVSIHTGLDTATIKSFEAGTFDGKTAVEKGLVNRVMTNKEFAAYVEAIHKGSI